jgi:hypothetical protein
VADKLYIIGIRWIKGPEDPAIVQNVLDNTPEITNWSRLNVHIWLAKSSLSAGTLAELLRRRMPAENSVFVIAASPHDSAGWAPQLIWNWLKNNFPT